MKEGRPELKPIISYFIIVAVIIILANAFLSRAS